MNNLKLKLMKIKMKLSEKSLGGSFLELKAKYPWTFWSLAIALVLFLFMFFTITLPGTKVLGVIVWKNLGWLVLSSAVIIFDVFLYEKMKNCEYDSTARKRWYLAWVLFSIAIIAVLCLYGNSVQSLWQ